MKKFDLELAVGFFLIIGIVCLGYLSVKLGGMDVMGGGGYELEAFFSNSGGLRPGSSVVIAGVDVGQVKKVLLDNYEARVSMNIPDGLKIQEDAIVSIKTRGLIGEKYVEITPGGSEEILKPGDRIRDTQPPVDLEQLISSYVFGKI